MTRCCRKTPERLQAPCVSCTISNVVLDASATYRLEATGQGKPRLRRNTHRWGEIQPSGTIISPAQP
ncbi:MAG: hypothetical protein IPH00_01370 [Flavobacteriales bacterium]|nr:hypothetical protein [Flavobacteriales bacterium]